MNQAHLIRFFRDHLPFSSDYLPAHTYLVGGAVRDALLQRTSNDLDLDFVLPNHAVMVARKIANDYQGGFVVLDQERQIARVVLPSMTIDFAQQEGETIVQDLGRRDYTINAIAFDCEQQTIIDPWNGQKDLQNQTIRMISESNLIDDPLRLLRAYRQACQLQFQIEGQTHATIRKLAPRLNQVSAERVNHELSYLLASQAGSFWLQEAARDGILSVWLRNMERQKLNYLERINDVVNFISEKWAYFRQLDDDWLSLAKLFLLTSSNAEVAEAELIQLKYSRREIRGVITITKVLPRLLDADPNFSLRQQYFFFLDVGKFFPSLALAALVSGVERDLITILIDRYVDNQDLVAHPQPLLTGNDLIRELNLSPSPLLKELLTEIAIARIEDKISNTNEALNWAKTIITAKYTSSDKI